MPGGYPSGAVSSPTRCWRFPATPQYVAHARYVVAAHARWLGADPATVALAVSEAFTSAVVHVPDAAHPGDVEVTVVRRPGELEVCVCDDAPATELVNGAAAADELGLKMLRQITTRLERTRRAQGGTEVRMSFPVA
jgi:anti-sigma regulatory factor (Ser/Thr protein kinase)